MSDIIPKIVDLSKKLQPFENKWVALSRDHKRILGSGDNLNEAKKEAEKKSKEYIFLKLPPFDVKYVPIGIYEISLHKSSNKRPAKKMDC